MAIYEEWQYVSKANPNITLGTSPATWCGAPEYTEIMCVKVSCGGGMGGSVWYEYVDRHDYATVKIGGVEMVEYTRWDGKKITLNPRWIVKIENFTMIRASLLRSRQYFPDDHGKPLHRRYLTEDGVKVTLVENSR